MISGCYIDKNTTSRHYQDAGKEDIIDAHNYNITLDVRLWQSDSALLDECKSDATWTHCLPAPSRDAKKADADDVSDEMIAGKVQELVSRFEGRSSTLNGGKLSSSMGLCQSDMMTCVPSRSSKSPTSPDQIRSSTEDGADVSTSINVAAEANSRIRYEIGQALLDGSHTIPFCSPSEASALLTDLPLNSPLFVRRTSREWTFAVLAGRRTNSLGETSLMVYCGKGDGWKKKVLKKKRWGGYLRLVNQEAVSWDPPSVDGSNASRPPVEIASCPSKMEKPRRFSHLLESEVRLYKLNTLDPTDQCRELSDQKGEVDSKLRVAQTRASKAKLPRLDTTKKMDEMVAALRALAKTTVALKRENEKIGAERDLLKSKLEDTEQAKVSLEARLAAGHAQEVLHAIKGTGRARAKEAKGSSLEEMTKSVEELESEKQCLQDCLEIVTEKFFCLQSNLDVALGSKQAAEAERDDAKAREVEMKAEIGNIQEHIKRKNLEIDAGECD